METYLLWFLKPCYLSLLKETQKFSTLKPAAMLVVQENTTEATLWINLLYITISSLPSAFGWVFKGVFTIKEDSTYSTWKRVSNCSNFHRRWCFQGFGVSTREVMKFKVTYFTCPAVCFQSPVSLNIEGIKVPGELLRFQFQVSFQPPQAAPPWNTMSNIHITLCFSAFCHLQTAAMKPTHCLTVCYRQCLLPNP